MASAVAIPSMAVSSMLPKARTVHVSKNRNFLPKTGTIFIDIETDPGPSMFVFTGSEWQRI